MKLHADSVCDLIPIGPCHAKIMVFLLVLPFPCAGPSLSSHTITIGPDFCCDMAQMVGDLPIFGVVSFSLANFKLSNIHLCLY